MDETIALIHPNKPFLLLFLYVHIGVEDTAFFEACAPLSELKIRH